MSDRGDDYEVGYGRPPVATRFRKGQSGNPAGRRKGSRNISAVIAAALAERVIVNEKGRRRSMTKLEAASTQLANKAAGGDARAAKLIIELLHQAEVRDEAKAPGQTQVNTDAKRAADQILLAAIRDQALEIARAGGEA